jgi:hypothetical protein
MPRRFKIIRYVLSAALGADSRQVASLGLTLDDAVELAVATPTHRLRAGLHKEL